MAVSLDLSVEMGGVDPGLSGEKLVDIVGRFGRLENVLVGCSLRSILCKRLTPEVLSCLGADLGAVEEDACEEEIALSIGWGEGDLK